MRQSGGLGNMPLTLFVLVAAIVLYLHIRRANLGIDTAPSEAVTVAPPAPAPSVLIGPPGPFIGPFQPIGPSWAPLPMHVPMPTIEPLPGPVPGSVLGG